MSRLDALNIPTMAEVNAVRRAVPKYAMKGQVAEKADAIIDEKKLERGCLKVVWKRDESKCRVCGCKVVKSLDRVPNRGEGHHIAGRADRAVRYDSRNRILVCAIDHERLELNKLFIVATAKQMFTCKENGKSYINGNNKKIRFIEKAAA